MRSLVVGLMAVSLSACSGNAGFPPVTGAHAHTPTLHLTRGEVITFHLAFAPTESGLYRSLRARTKRLELVRNPSWRVRGAGAFTLFVRPKRGGDASYTGCVRFD